MKDFSLVLLLFAVQQLSVALLSGSTIGGFELIAFSFVILSQQSVLLHLVGSIVYYGVGGDFSLFCLCLTVFARHTSYFLTKFEADIVHVLSILCAHHVFSAGSFYSEAANYSNPSSMHFVYIAYTCIVSGCFMTWLSHECFIYFAPSLAVPNLQWLMKLGILGVTVAIAVHLVDAVSMINWMLCLVFYSEKGMVAKMCVVWSLLIAATIQLSNYLSTLQNLKKTIVRKLFHVLAFLLFTPALLLELHSFLCLSIGLVLCLFLLLEFLRVYVFADFSSSQPTLSMMSRSANYFTWFAHKKELQARHGIVLSHITLLSGCGYSIYLFVAVQSRMDPHLANSGANAVRVFALRLLPYMGIVSVCIADSLASVCGSLWGRMKWQQGGNRTILGSLAAFAGMLVSCIGLLVTEYWLHGADALPLEMTDLGGLLVVLVCVSGVTILAEAFTIENDNLVLPFCSSCSYLLLVYLLF